MQKFIVPSINENSEISQKVTPMKQTLFRSLQTAVVTSALQNFVSKEEKPKGGAPAAKPVRYQPSFNLNDGPYVVGAVHFSF